MRVRISAKSALIQFLAAILPAAAIAAMNIYGNLALPPTVTVWGTSYESRNFSAICVSCHTENPSAHIPASSLPFSESETFYRGSHFVRNTLDGADRQTIKKWAEKTTQWAGSLGYSKYGVLATKSSVTGANGEMICESCHNLVINKGENLLLETYDAATGNVALCVGCHVNEATGTPYHHPLSGTTVGADADYPAGSHFLDVTHISHLRTVAAIEADKSKTLGTGYYGTGPLLTCMGCHKPHRAMTSTGARILRRGNSLVTTTLNKPINVVYTNGVPDPGVVTGDVILRAPSGKTATGLHRQSDMDSGKRIVINSDPLCQACH